MERLYRRGLAAASALCALFLLSAPARAVIPFTAENTLILSSVTAQDVQPTAAGFRMYVTSNGFTVLSATSTDQVSWSLESGVRLSTGTSGLDVSSITALGTVYLSTNAADGLRMYYVGISAAGAYSVLSATSTDGLSWSKEAGTRLQRNSGAAFLDSPRALRVSSTLVRLFYVADNAGTNVPANYRVFSATATDGLNFTDEGAVLSADQAFQVCVTTLTDGRTRAYFSAPDVAGSTTPARVLSAISSNGTIFSKESGVRISTASAALTYPVVVRSTDSYRWRMFSSFVNTGSTTPFVSSAKTLTPVPRTMSPSTVLKSQSGLPFTVTGEIFSPSPAVSFYLGTDTITATGVARADDLTITGTIDPFNRVTGMRNLVVTNADGTNGTLVNGVLVDIAPGTVNAVDNLFRPLHGQSCTITVQIFDASNVTIRVYTSAGGLVTTLFDGPLPEGSTSFHWDGRTAAGHVVASGVYILRTRGPKLDDTQKIVVIK